MFYTSNYKIIQIGESDIPQITKIYNSNTNFLQAHIGANCVNNGWVLKEYRHMLANGFYSCKIIDIKSDLPVGFMDFKISADTYLSIIMIHAESRKKGIGKEVIHRFAEYVKDRNSRCIRIDVVTDYDESVLKFWLSNGFVSEERISLFWNEKELSALKMIKNIL